MPIWLHRLLGIPIQVVGAFGGALAGMGCGWMCLGSLSAGKDAGTPEVLLYVGYAFALITGALCFFGGGWFGRFLFYGLYVRHVPARCPQCRGRIYFQSELGDEVRYRCRSCKHKYVGRSWQE